MIFVLGEEDGGGVVAGKAEFVKKQAAVVLNKESKTVRV